MKETKGQIQNNDEKMNCFDTPVRAWIASKSNSLPLHTFPTMLEPGIRAERAVLAQLHPLRAQRAEDAVRLHLA